MYTFHFINESEKICLVLKEFLECFPRLLDRVTSIEEYAIKLSKSACIVVMNEHNLNLGICCYYANDNETFTGYISLIGIKNAYQSTGRGRKLLEFVSNQCRIAGMRKLKLEVDADNEKAIAFYKRYSFQLISMAREESYYMELDL